MDFNVTASDNLIDVVSDFTLQLSFQNLPLGEFWYNIKEEIPYLILKVCKNTSFFSKYNIFEARLSLHTSNKMIYFLKD